MISKRERERKRYFQSPSCQRDAERHMLSRNHYFYAIFAIKQSFFDFIMIKLSCAYLDNVIICNYGGGILTKFVYIVS